MSAVLPEVVDAWRMVTARRCFEGTVPLSQLARLATLLADTAGDCRYSLEFQRDELGVACVQVGVEAGLPLLCQRTLERFVLPVAAVLKLALVRDEREEAALPADLETVLVDAEGQLKPLDLIEDELILLLPVVPVKPGSEAIEPAPPAEPQARTDNPFAVLAAMKKRKD